MENTISELNDRKDSLALSNYSSWASTRDIARDHKLRDEIADLAEKGRNRKNRFKKLQGLKLRDYKYYNEIISFIKETRHKYDQIGDEKSLEGLKSNGLSFVNRFRANKKELLARGMESKKELQYCKSYVEWGYFLGSLYGSKFIPMNIGDFLNVIGPEGILSPRKMSERLNQDRALFEIKKKEIRVSFESRFDDYIEYMMSINPQGKSPIARVSAYNALEEAVTKYQINSSNLDSHLKIALQHIDWGLREGYKSLQPRSINEVKTREIIRGELIA